MTNKKGTVKIRNDPLSVLVDYLQCVKMTSFIVWSVKWIGQLNSHKVSRLVFATCEVESCIFLHKQLIDIVAMYPINVPNH